MNFKFNNSIIFKLSLALGIVSASILIVFIVFISIKTRKDAIESAERTALAESHECAKQIQLELSKAIIVNRMLCQTIGSVNHQHPDDLSREAVNTMLKNTLETFPDLFGAYTVWEPNAFDNKDAQFTSSENSLPGHDTTGRLIPLWYRSTSGEIKLVPLDGYDNEQSSAWYFMPQKTGKETVMDPFYYKNMYMISVVNPIIKNERFLGVTGISMKMSFVQKMVDEFDVFNKKGEVTILSDAGTVVASSNNPKLAGKEIPAKYKIPAGIFTDSKEEVLIQKGELQAFVPFKLGDSGKTWVAMVQIPSQELLAGSNNLILVLFLSGLATIALLVVGIYFFANRLTKPLLSLVGVAEDIALGKKPELEAVSNSIEAKQLLGSLDKIVSSQKELASVHKAISENDFNKKAIVRSPEDELSLSVNKMIENLQAASLEGQQISLQRSEQLEQFKKQAEILKAREAELSKNIEELQSKQEEIQKVYAEEVEKKIEQLKATHEEELRNSLAQHQDSQAEIKKVHAEELTKKIEQLKTSQEEKARKSLEELQFAKVELQSAKVDLARKETAYLAEIEKLKLGVQKEVQLKTSTFSKFVVPVDIK